MDDTMLQVTTLERLSAAVEQLERLLAASTNSIGPIVATVANVREVELEQRLAEAEATIATLRAASSVAASSTQTGRKTLPVSMVSLLAKQGVAVDSLEAGALDAALTSLSIEQRIAVKSELMRAGLLG